MMFIKDICVEYRFDLRINREYLSPRKIFDDDIFSCPWDSNLGGGCPPGVRRFVGVHIDLKVMLKHEELLPRRSMICMRADRLTRLKPSHPRQTITLFKIVLVTAFEYIVFEEGAIVDIVRNKPCDSVTFCPGCGTRRLQAETGAATPSFRGAKMSNSPSAVQRGS